MGNNNDFTDENLKYCFRKVAGYHSPKELYEMLYGKIPDEIQVASGGGDRVYCRLFSEGSPSVVGTVGPDLKENEAFVKLSTVFRDNGVNVPEIFIASEDFRSYLQSDLGDNSLLALLSTDRRFELAKASLSRLVEMQTIEEKAWLPFVNFSPFSRRMVMWDLNYFKYEFVKPCGVAFDEDLLENDFENLSERISRYDAPLWGFMYRDFQSRNILIKEGTPYFIDYQGGRKGPCLYDAVSFLWQAKAGFSRGERETLLNWYAMKFAEARGLDPSKVLGNVGQMALLRTLQVLGAYGFRGLVEKRSHFIESIPPALANLSELLSDGALEEYPELKSVCKQLVERRYAAKENDHILTVKVYSFSYKKGYPEDLSGNGGGFMFDCRGMHNPGRYEQYKPLTGLDREVIDFLEQKAEVEGFLDNAYRLVSPSVSRYLERGFTNLMVGFGCTGGRHRSVYCAQKMAEKLAKNYSAAKIEIIHREQGIHEILNSGERK